MSDYWVSLSDTDDDVGYFADDHDRTHCRHGTFTGYPGGADYLCVACESGWDTWVEDPGFELFVRFDDGLPIRPRVRWRASDIDSVAPTVLKAAAYWLEFADKADTIVTVEAWAERTDSGYWTGGDDE